MSSKISNLFVPSNKFFSRILYSSFLIFNLCIIIHAQEYNENSKITLEGCICDSYSCGCCTHMNVPELKINDTACICLGVDPYSYILEFVVTLDNHALMNATISGRNPPPVCLPIPFLGDFVDGCVHFHNLDFGNGSFRGCADIEIDMWRIFRLVGYTLGCWDTKDSRLELSNQNINSSITKLELLPNQGINSNMTYGYVDESIVVVDASAEVTEYFKDRVKDFLLKSFMSWNETVAVYRDRNSGIVGRLYRGKFVSNSYERDGVCYIISNSSAIKFNIILMLISIYFTIMAF